MRVRVYDESTQQYFKSEVYAIVDRGYGEQLLVLVPGEVGGHLRFFDRLRKQTDPMEYAVQTIMPKCPESWIIQTFEPEDGQNTPLEMRQYSGFPWLLEEKETLPLLLHGRSVPVKGSCFSDRLYSDIDQPGWTFVETQADAAAFLRQVCGMHDSVLHSLQYVSGASVSTDGGMYPMDDQRTVTMTIQSQCCPNFELVFEGVTALHVRPSFDNQFCIIFDATLIVEQASLFFCDEECGCINTAYPGTWITAYSLKWRFLKDK